MRETKNKFKDNSEETHKIEKEHESEQKHWYMSKKNKNNLEAPRRIRAETFLK